MDTLTNVVGVLIIVLIMIGISLAKAVNKAISELPPVTKEEYEKIQKSVTAATPQNNPQKVEEEIAQREQALKKIAEELQELESQEPDAKRVEVRDIEKQIEERTKERNARKARVEALLEEIDRLKKQLDTTPVYVPPPAITVKMPNPRPIPAKTVIEHFVVAGERIIYLNSDAYLAMVLNEFKSREADLSLNTEIVKGPDGKPVMQADKTGRLSPKKRSIYDPKKVVDYFAKAQLNGQEFGLNSRNIKVSVAPEPNSPNIEATLIIGPDAGETITQAKNFTSGFQDLLKKIKRDDKSVVWFHIAKDSIPTYLAARDITESKELPATWDFSGPLTNSGTLSIKCTLPQDYTVPYTPPPTPPPSAPPAPTPPSAAPTPPPIIIAPPKATLD